MSRVPGAWVAEKRRFGFLREGVVPRATQSPTARDLGWVAGFLEGECHVRKGCNPGDSARHQIRVLQKDREPIDRLASLVGGKITKVTTRAPYNGKIHEAWMWSVTGARARGIMMTVFTMMSRRRKDRIKEALAA